MMCEVVRRWVGEGEPQPFVDIKIFPYVCPKNHWVNSILREKEARSKHAR